MIPVVLDSNGKIPSAMHPAIYLDTNVLRLYYLYEGYENLGEDEVPDQDQASPPAKNTYEDKTVEYVQELVGFKSKGNTIGAIRQAVLAGTTKASLIMSNLGLLELHKIKAEISFKSYCADALGPKYIQRMGEKQVGEHLLKAWKKSKEDTASEIGKDLIRDTWLNLSFVRAHGLSGVYHLQETNLQLSETDTASFLAFLAYIQLDPVDILHFHIAKQTGCTFFATLDSGFKAAKQIILEQSGITILDSEDALLDEIRKHKVA